MKKIYEVIFLAVLLTSCGEKSKSPEIKGIINGTYVRQAASEYSKAQDTLIVTPYDLRAGTFLILRKTGFQRIVNGRLQPRETRSENMITVWDEETHQLQELKVGKLFTFPYDGKELLAGTAKYIKIE